LYKRKSFEHERELRAVAFEVEERSQANVILKMDPLPGGGVAIPVDVEKLVEKVYVAPKTPGWFRDVVESALRQYGFSGIPVAQSKLYDAPLY
jgi:hypothetical protein